MLCVCFTVFNVLTVLTVHTGEGLFLGVFFFIIILTVFTVLVGGVYFAWYVFLDRFAVLIVVLTVLSDMILFLVDFYYDFFDNE